MTEPTTADPTPARHTCRDQTARPGPDWECPRCSTLPDAAAPAVSSAGVVQLPPTNQAVPSRRAGLRDEIAAALEAADYRMDMRRGDLADAVLPVLYREWPWLRAEAEDAVAPVDRAAWDALCREAGRLRRASAEMVDRAERIEAQVRQLVGLRATVLREEAALIRAHCPDHLDANSAEGSWMNCHCDVADDMERRMAAEAPATEEQDAGHTCGNCDGIDPDSCLMNPGRPKRPPMNPWRILGIGNCPTPESHNWGCGCPTDVAAAIASCPGREIDGPSPCRCPCEGCKHNCAAHQPEPAVVQPAQPHNDETQDGAEEA
ncbi:hypothetical protein ACIRJM_23095 [Streptomyces sp. NPDC102405]|uniref:hypothetical protein n=1 Tax=Streptomyces sp. NPDC102405 TaxID=3366170 RepID=UPI00382D9E82